MAPLCLAEFPLNVCLSLLKQWILEKLMEILQLQIYLIRIKVEAGVVLKWPFPTGKAERGVLPYHLRDEAGALPSLAPPHTSPQSQVDSRAQKQLRSSYKAQKILLGLKEVM